MFQFAKETEVLDVQLGDGRPDGRMSGEEIVTSIGLGKGKDLSGVIVIPMGGITPPWIDFAVDETIKNTFQEDQQCFPCHLGLRKDFQRTARGLS